ncbi:unnamed protein product [Darwinula stevensoni]|uniref:Son of sevenless n=1 Tax=Darwinula stevensoni TaxID=69355 RepID=A0A7R8X059_9CRUS|nr:unnamed protein product [Darwinula stevensoni]CAG0881346.1 unnamed protein product [Darwinula stevensoni]
MKPELLGYKVDYQVSVYIVAVLEYLAADILKLVGNYVKIIHRSEISPEDIEVAMYADKVLMDLFHPEGGGLTSPSGGLPLPEERALEEAKSYDQVVKDLIAREKMYLRELHLATKVFREQITSLNPFPESVDRIFSNVDDVVEVTQTLLASLEDAVEMSEDSHPLTIGACFEDLAEAEEFDVYDKYIRDILSPKCREELDKLLSRPDVNTSLLSGGHGFREAVRYVLPKLLLSPVFHLLLYFDYLKACLRLATVEDDRLSLEQVMCLLNPLKVEVERVAPSLSWSLGDKALYSYGRTSRQEIYKKMADLQRMVDGWDNKDIGQCCNEFIGEGSLGKVVPGKRATERYVFLFDGLVVLCKSNARRGSVSVTGGPAHELRIKEKFFIRKVEIRDREDCDEVKNGFEIAPRFQPHTILFAKNPDEKNAWMAALVMLNIRRSKAAVVVVVVVAVTPTARAYDAKPFWVIGQAYKAAPFQAIILYFNSKSPGVVVVVTPAREAYNNTAEQQEGVKSELRNKRAVEPAEQLDARNAALSMLDRTLDSLLSDMEAQHPLPLPDPSVYRFSEEDGPHNLILEETRRSPVPLIKGATLIKLVERVTYHLYADPTLVRTFLTTFRTFTTPQQLLDLLIERFQIPEPRQVTTRREIAKRFRREYLQPVQFRVLNVIRQWVDRHFYDFEQDPELLAKLQGFLSSIQGKAMRKWQDSICKIIYRRLDGWDDQREITLDRSPPPIEWHLSVYEEEYNLLTLHPIELARQLTLLEFELYRAVKPSELVGHVWTKKNKDLASPNLLRMIRHTDNITRWLQKSIVEMENLEERVAVVTRVLEIMMVLQDLNNFNGVIEVSSAMDSAAIHRLQFTRQNVPVKYLKALEDARELSKDHFKKYQDRLRSINPPCVPFFGLYLTNIVHIEDGNPDKLATPQGEPELINFNKRRRVAEITGEIQQYQNQPYCLSPEPKIRYFLENLRPFEGLEDKEIQDYLYSKSLEIEPRNVDRPPRYPRKWPTLPLKSPGIKPRHLPGKTAAPYPLSLTSSISDRLSLFSTTSISRLHSLAGDDSISSHGTMSDMTDMGTMTTSPSVITPPTPSTPLTPPLDTSIFAPVLIGHPEFGGPSSPGGMSTGSSVQSPRGDRDDDTPPPLPPRRRGNEAPPLPPRGVNRLTTPPPLDTHSQVPLPPRRTSASTPPLFNGMSPGTPTGSSTPRHGPLSYGPIDGVSHFIYPPPVPPRGPELPPKTVYVVARTDAHSKEKVLEAERGHSGQWSMEILPRSREVAQSYLTSIFTTLVAIFWSIPLVWRHRPDLVLVNGPGTCIPICFVVWLLRVLRIKRCMIVFVESVCRVQTLSLSGKILEYFADDILVQWPELLGVCPRASFLGRLVGHCILFSTGHWNEEDGKFLASWASQFYCVWSIFVGILLFGFSCVQVFRFAKFLHFGQDSSFLSAFLDVVLNVLLSALMFSVALTITMGFQTWCSYMILRFQACQYATLNPIITDVDTSGFFMQVGTAQFGAWMAWACCVGLSVASILKLWTYHQRENMRLSMAKSRQRLCKAGLEDAADVDIIQA